MEDFNTAVGKRIRETRKKRGYTIEQLAEYADISSDFLGLIEKGQQSMKIQNMSKIASALGVTTDYLIYGNMYYDDFPAINTMLSSMTEDERKHVEELIALFLKSIRSSAKEQNNNKDTENK